MLKIRIQRGQKNPIMVTVRDSVLVSKSKTGIQLIKGDKLPNLITLLLSFLKESFTATPFF
jgi:hypothetical protein